MPFEMMLWAPRNDELDAPSLYEDVLRRGSGQRRSKTEASVFGMIESLLPVMDVVDSRPIEPYLIGPVAAIAYRRPGFVIVVIDWDDLNRIGPEIWTPLVDRGLYAYVPMLNAVLPVREPQPDWAMLSAAGIEGANRAYEAALAMRVAPPSEERLQS